MRSSQLTNITFIQNIAIVNEKYKILRNISKHETNYINELFKKKDLNI